MSVNDVLCDIPWGYLSNEIGFARELAAGECDHHHHHHHHHHHEDPPPVASSTQDTDATYSIIHQTWDGIIWERMTHRERSNRDRVEALLRRSADVGRVKHEPDFYEAAAMPIRYKSYSLRDHVDDAVSTWTRRQNFSAMLSRPVARKEVRNNPRASAALQIEWDRLRQIPAWDEKRVREWGDIAQEAKEKNVTVHVGRVFDITVESMPNYLLIILNENLKVELYFREIMLKIRIASIQFLMNSIPTPLHWQERAHWMPFLCCQDLPSNKQMPIKIIHSHAKSFLVIHGFWFLVNNGLNPGKR